MDAVREMTARLGYLFYLVGPSKTTFEHVHETPNYIADVSRHHSFFRAVVPVVVQCRHFLYGGQVTPWFFTFIFIEQLVLKKRRQEIPPFSDSLTSAANGGWREIIQQ